MLYCRRRRRGKLKRPRPRRRSGRRKSTTSSPASNSITVLSLKKAPLPGVAAAPRTIVPPSMICIVTVVKLSSERKGRSIGRRAHVVVTPGAMVTLQAYPTDGVKAITLPANAATPSGKLHFLPIIIPPDHTPAMLIPDRILGMRRNLDERYHRCTALHIVSPQFATGTCRREPDIWATFLPCAPLTREIGKPLKIKTLNAVRFLSLRAT